ncbi:MAG: ATP-binding protein [Microthrixaceae bacterium]|nr:ATP-binding protein [Microthrixaceae bacterium]
MSRRPPKPSPEELARVQGIPRVNWIQKSHNTDDASDAIFLATHYRLIPDLWQAAIVTAWLGTRRDGKWTHPRCGLAVPRQNGKNGALEVRELFGLVVLGEAILHTAHQIKTSRKAFKRLKHFFGECAEDPDAKFPELNDLVAEVRNTNGQEAIVLKDRWLADGTEIRSTGRPDGADVEYLGPGGFIEFATRTQRGGRGTTYDLLVVDEAQHLSEEDLEAIRPVISSARLGNAQIIYLGTPPDPEKLSAGVGEAWTRIRKGAGTARDLAWVEYGAPDGPMPDLDDLLLLYACNPSLEVRHGNGDYGLSLEVIFGEDGTGGEKADLTPAGLARERFGWWGNPEAKSHRGVIDMDQWRALRVDGNDLPTRGLVVVDCSPDLEWTSVAIATDGPDGRPLGLIDRKEGTAWAPARVAQLVNDIEICIDPKTRIGVYLTPSAKHMASKLTELGIDHHVLTATEAGAGCSTLLTRIPTKGAAHVGQPDLDAAARNAITKYSGNVMQWDQRKTTVDISALVAYSIAIHLWFVWAANPPTPPPAPRTFAAPAVDGYDDSVDWNAVAF